MRPLYFVGQITDDGNIENLTRDYVTPRAAVKVAKKLKIYPDTFVDERIALYQVPGSSKTNDTAREIDWKTYYS